MANFVIELKVINGTIQAHGDFENGMTKDDTASFVVPPGSVEIRFTPLPSVLQDGKPGPSNLVPFPASTIKNPAPGQTFAVKNFCKSMMTATITMDGRPIHCPWDRRGNVTGTIICTGGGNSPIKCP